MLIAFVKTTDASPLQIPSIISKIPKNARAGPIHLDSVIFRIIFPLSIMIIFYFETFFVDKDGNIVGDTYTGSHTLDEWKEIVEKELKNVSK